MSLIDVITVKVYSPSASPPDMIRLKSVTKSRSADSNLHGEGRAFLFISGVTGRTELDRVAVGETEPPGINMYLFTLFMITNDHRQSLDHPNREKKHDRRKVPPHPLQSHDSQSPLYPKMKMKIYHLQMIRWTKGRKRSSRILKLKSSESWRETMTIPTKRTIQGTLRIRRTSPFRVGRNHRHMRKSVMIFDGRSLRNLPVRVRAGVCFRLLLIDMRYRTAKP
jgi:hypothetical protein